MEKEAFIARRRDLRAALPDGVILVMGNDDSPRNYAANTYPFRQDASFIYYTGLHRLPSAALLIDPEGGERLFGTPPHPDDVIWHGPHLTLADHATHAGIAQWEDMARLAEVLTKWRHTGARIHYLPPYRGERLLRLAALLSLPPAQVQAEVSRELMRAVVDQRNHKSPAEVAEIEEALNLTHRMFAAAEAALAPGRSEAEIMAALVGPALAMGRATSFLPIVTVRGEVLHNEGYDNTLQAGDLLLCDCGTESEGGYASDITRTWPVSGAMSSRQSEIYQVVLSAQQAAIATAQTPGRSNLEVHLAAARAITTGLGALGLMQGDPDAGVAAGAHALFFPHGIGHMLGLDVHDMEDLGDLVGYGEGKPRSQQFGLAALRLARTLEPGHVITIEPGIYFIPALIERWAAERRHQAFIDYDRVQTYVGFGGVRIEDDLLITAEGARVLGPTIPK